MCVSNRNRLKETKLKAPFAVIEALTPRSFDNLDQFLSVEDSIQFLISFKAMLVRCSI